MEKYDTCRDMGQTKYPDQETAVWTIPLQQKDLEPMTSRQFQTWICSEADDDKRSDCAQSSNRSDVDMASGVYAEQFDCRSSSCSWSHFYWPMIRGYACVLLFHVSAWEGE